MPFKSAAQRRLLYAKEPEVAEEFARKEKEARLTPSSFSKPTERPTGTTMATTSNANKEVYTPKKKTPSKPKINIKRAAQRRMKPNGNSSSSTGSGY